MDTPSGAGGAAVTSWVSQRMAAAWSRCSRDVAPAAVVCAWLSIVFWCALRFIALDVSPPGFFMDEALGALHVQCLAESGRSAHGVPWPLFAEGLNGGFYTPTFLYSGLLWTRVFGLSIASVRALAAAYSVATVIGLWLLARELGDAASARLVALAAAVSPWAFQFARMAWDPPLAPAFLVWGVWAFVRGNGVMTRGWAGLLLSLAMYSYPPMRVQAPLVLLLLLVCERRSSRALSSLACCAVFVGASLPLVFSSLEPRFVDRAASLSILTPDYIRARGGDHPLGFVISQLLDNLYEHLRPSYLFLTGDTSLRHSSQVIGELSVLDDLALVALVLLIVRRFLARAPVSPSPRRAYVWMAAALAGVFGVLPSALTHEGLPHALRSIGAWPALALCTGTVLASVWSRSERAAWLIVGLAALQTAYFVPLYFGDYRQRAAGEFQAELRAAAESRQLPQLSAAGRHKNELQLRYFLIRDFGYNCESSREPAARIRRGLPLDR